jgi:hypothetical protein
MLKYKLENSASHQNISLEGDFTENCEKPLNDLLPQLNTGTAVFNCSKIDDINSFGTKIWIQFLQDLGKKVKIEFVECSLTFMSYRNLIPSFAGDGKIKSIVVVFECLKCGEIINKVFEEQAFSVDHEIEPQKCGKCGGNANSSVEAEELFSFTEE